MKIKMLTTMACPERCVSAGKTIDLPEAEALVLIEGGYAEPLNKVPAFKANKPAEAEGVEKSESALNSPTESSVDGVSVSGLCKQLNVPFQTLKARLNNEHGVKVEKGTDLVPKEVAEKLTTKNNE